MKYIIYLLIFFLGLVFVQPMYAVISGSTPPNKVVKKAEKELKKKQKLEKHLKKLELKLEKVLKRDVDFDLDAPVNKWLWLAILGWVAGLILAILSWILPDLGLLGKIGYLAGLAGTVFFVIWIVKLFE